MRCLTATVTEQEVPEADAWGGGDVKVGMVLWPSFSEPFS